MAATSRPCTNENCPAHGHLLREQREARERVAYLEDQVLLLRAELFDVLALWSWSIKIRADLEHSQRCEACGWMLDSQGGCAWCDDSNDGPGALGLGR